jgi:hypothetical protein
MTRLKKGVMVDFRFILICKCFYQGVTIITNEIPDYLYIYNVW